MRLFELCCWATLIWCVSSEETCLSDSEDGASCSSSRGEPELFGGWKPWDDGKFADLVPALASDSPGEDCFGTVETVESRLSFPSALDRLKQQLVQDKSNLREEVGTPPANGYLLYIAANGAEEGTLVSIKNTQCLGTIAQEASLTLDAWRSIGSAIYQPKRLYSNTGRPVKSWLDVVRSDFVLHILLDREAWQWPALAVGFSFRVSGVELVTVAKHPKVFLAKDVVSEEDAKKIVETGSKNLFRSPEKHYSDDPKYHNYRTSETGNLSDQEPSARRLRRLSQQVLRLEHLEFVEPLQLLRYEPGKWYKEHYDVFHNVSPLSTLDEEVKLLKIPEELSRWAEQQRRLLWRMFMNARKASSSDDMELTAARLFSRQEDPWYPNLRSGRFLASLATALGKRSILSEKLDMVRVHIAWLRNVFCSGDAVDDSCVIQAAEMLDRMEDRFPDHSKPHMIQRNRHVTMLPYLTEVEEGGETVFPLSHSESLFGDASKLVREGMGECSRGIYVPPVARSAAVFYHTTGDSLEVDRLSMHGGCPPVRGVKYAINVFCWNLNWSSGLKVVNHSI